MAEKEYIERKALMHDIMKTVIVSEKTGFYTNPELKGINKVIDRIKAQPTADVQKVRHGEWIRIKDRFFSSTDGKGGNVVKCSVCGEPSSCGLSTPYCSICGAKMDKE
ncbi:MAG: hypothetical protein ACI4RM_02495 [Ruminococcus sp.]